MYKKRVKYHQRRYRLLLILSRKNDLSLADCISLLRSIAKCKSDKRLNKRHGSFTDWSEAESFLDTHITVPVKFNHNKEIHSYCCFEKSDLPPEYSHLKELTDE